MDFAKILHEGILGFAQSSWALIRDSFSAGSMTSEWWITVVGGQVVTRVDGSVVSTVDHPGMLNVVVIAMIPLLMIFVVLQVVLSVFRGSTAGMVRALVVSVVAVPAIYVVTGIIWVVLAAVDRLTMWILSIGANNGEADALGALLNLFGLAYDPATGDVLVDENYEQWAMAAEGGDPGKFIMPFLVALIIFLVCLVLLLMMMFRLVAVVVLTVFGPLAIFSLALEPARAVGSRWVSILIGLIVAKPVAAVIVKIGMIAASVGSSWVQLAAGIILILLAAAMPLALLSMVSFVTGGATDNIERQAVMGGQRVLNSSRSTVRGTTRVAGRAGRGVGRALSSRGGASGPRGPVSPGGGGAARRAQAPPTRSPGLRSPGN